MLAMTRTALAQRTQLSTSMSNTRLSRRAHLIATCRSIADFSVVALGRDPLRVAREMCRRCRVNAQRTRRIFSSISMQ